VKTVIKEYVRHDLAGALILLIAVSAAVVLMTHVRLSDIDGFLWRCTYAIAEAARTVAN
jgi:hypothetical protein